MGILADERPRKKLVKENARITRMMSTDRPVFLGCGTELPSSSEYGERENHFIVAFEQLRQWKEKFMKSVRKQREGGPESKQGEANG
jgi:hypothetical protein